MNFTHKIFTIVALSLLIIGLPNSVYAVDGDTITQEGSLEHDTVDAQWPALIKSDSGIYVLAYATTGDDGVIKTFSISDDGSTVTQIQSLTHDNSQSLYNSIIQVDSDTYAVAYSGTSNIGVISTFTIPTDGSTITEVKEQTFEATLGQYHSWAKVDSDTFALAYSGTDNDGFIKTFDISADGNTITNIDTEEHDTQFGQYNSFIKTDSGIYVLAYLCTDGNNGCISTFTIQDDGTSITEVQSLEHDLTTGIYNSLVQADSDTYVLAYEGVGNDGIIKTFTIPTNGATITQIQSLAHDADRGAFQSIIRANEEIYVLAYDGSSNADGFIKTFNIPTSGATISEIHSFEHDTSHGDHNSIVKVDFDTVALATRGTAGQDGYVVAFNINIPKSESSTSKHAGDSGKPPSFGLTSPGGAHGFDNRPQLDHAIKYNGFVGGPFEPGLNHNPLIQIETGNLQSGFDRLPVFDGEPRPDELSVFDGESRPDGLPGFDVLNENRFDGMPDEFNNPQVNNILDQRGDFSTKLKDLFNSPQSEQSFVNDLNRQRDLEQIDTIIGQHHAFNQQFSNIVEQHKIDGIIDDDHELNRILDEQREFPDKLKKLFDERNQIRGNVEVETRDGFLDTYDGVAREVDTLDNYFSKNPNSLLGTPVAPPQEVLRAFERLDRVTQDNRDVVNRLNPDQVARFGNISEQMAETISEIRRIIEPIETVTFSDERRTIPNIRFVTHHDEQIPEQTNELSQQLDKLRQLQNQLKTILDEITDEQKQIDNEIQSLLDKQAQLPSQIEELFSKLPETQEYSPPSNLMEIKFKDDRGISNVYYVKIHLGVQAAYKIGETTVTFYPNSDPYAIARGQEHGSYIKLNDPEGILDHNNIEIATKQVDCFTDSGDNDCVLLEFGHDFLQRPTHPFVGVEVVTLAKYKAYFLINDGIDVIGESKGPTVTQIITDPYDKHSAQITLTRADRIQDLWQDENDNTWTRNAMGSWIKMTHKDYHDFIDELDSKYNKLDGNFEKLTESESIKAKEIFDSSLIQQKIKSAYEIKMNKIHHRSNDPELQSSMMNELDKAKLIWNDELYFERHSLNPDYEKMFGKTNDEKIRFDIALNKEQDRITQLEQYEPYDLWNTLSEKYGEEFVTDFKNDLESKKNLNQELYFQNYFK